MKAKRISYKDSGVDLKAIKKSHLSIGKIISKTHSFIEPRKVISGFGHYAGLIELDKNTILGIHTDGVGTKVIIAQLLNKFDSIGIDCIAMNANDLMCMGIRPLALVDYIALKKSNNMLIRKIMQGLVKGAEEAGIAIVGGETAVIPDIINGNDKAFDLAGTVIGIGRKDGLITGSKIRDGDIIMGAQSSGLHSNGYSLARRVILSKYSIHEKLENFKKSIGEELLTPTRIYVNPMNEISEHVEVHGFAHITGGSFTKLSRLNTNVKFNLDSMPRPPEIFNLIQREGNISLPEMYRTFNMGVGLCIIIPRKSEVIVKDVFAKHRIRISRIGEVTKGDGEIILKDNLKSVLL